MFGSLVVDRTDINANTDAHRGGDGNLAEVLALRGSRLQLVELVDESHQVLLEAVSREGGTTDRGVDDTSLVGAELDLTGLAFLTAWATFGVTVPTFGFGIRPRGPRIWPSWPTTRIASGEAMTTSKSSSPALTLAARSSKPTISAPAARASSALAPG